MALSGVGELSARNRLDTTRNRLELVRAAVVGDGLDAGRFLQDMGRFPVVQSAAEGVVLSELWECPSGLAAGTVSQAPGWPDSLAGLPASVSLACGWNGPYLALSGSKLYDGFGNDFLVAKTASPAADASADWHSDATGGDPPSVGTDIAAILSRGADGDFTDAGWADANRMLDFAAQTAAVRLAVTVKARDLSGDTPSWHDPAPLAVRASGTAYAIGRCVTDSGFGPCVRVRFVGNQRRRRTVLDGRRARGLDHHRRRRRLDVPRPAGQLPLPDEPSPRHPLRACDRQFEQGDRPFPGGAGGRGHHRYPRPA